VKVIRHPMRYLINVSHSEMEALREIVERGLIDILDDDDPPLSTGARKSLAYWLPKRGKRPRNPLKPQRSPRTAKKPLEG
jgi:hypothetical protein